MPWTHEPDGSGESARARPKFTEIHARELHLLAGIALGALIVAMLMLTQSKADARLASCHTELDLKLLGARLGNPGEWKEERQVLYESKPVKPCTEAQKDQLLLSAGSGYDMGIRDGTDQEKHALDRAWVSIVSRLCTPQGGSGYNPYDTVLESFRDSTGLGVSRSIDALRSVCITLLDKASELRQISLSTRCFAAIRGSNDSPSAVCTP